MLAKMCEQNGVSLKDSGYASKLSSFSFDAKRSSFEASTPKKINENFSTKIQNNQQNAENNSFSQSKATDCFKSFGKNFDVHQVAAAHHKKTSDSVYLLDCKTIALISLILVFTVFVIAYKMILVAMPYTNAENLYEASTYAQEKFSRIYDWTQENQLSTRLYPLFCGLVVSLFSFMMVYMDSAVPGINPPVPFRSNTKAGYGQPNFSNINLNYLTAFASGAVVSALMWWNI